MLSTRARRFALLALAIGAAAMAGCRSGGRQDYAALMDSGARLLEKKEYVQAILQYRTAARLAPKNAEPLYRLGLAYLASGSVTEGVTALVKAADIDPKHAGAQIKLAELLSGSRDKKMLEEGQKRLQEVLSVRPADPDALTALAFTESRLGNLQGAEEHLRAALAASPASLKAAAVLARIRLAQRDIAGAEQALRSAIQESPASADARLAMAELLLVLNRPLEAEKELRAALAIDNRSAQAMLGLAALYSSSGRHDDAARMYRRISELGDPRYRHSYGAYLFTSGRRDAAIQEFERLAKLDPADRNARTRLVAAYLAVRRDSDADRVLESALRKNPGDVDALLLKSEMLVRAGKLGEAQRNLAEVLRFKPESAPAHQLMAAIYGARGSLRLQRQELTLALQHSPEFLQARLELARLHMDSNSPRLALDLLNQAPPSQRQTIPFVVARNHALYSTGDYEAFARGVAEGLSMARVPDLLLQDAQSKLLNKNYAGARASLREALEKNPEHLGALQVLYQAYAAQNSVSAALQALQQHAAAHPGSARIQYFLGERMLAAGRRQEARKFFVAAGAAGRGMVEADLALAQLDYEAGQYEAARKRLASLPPPAGERTSVLLLTAAVEHKAGNPKAAEQLYRKVLEADPSQVVALNNLASLLAEHENRPDEALKYAQQARELVPDNPDVCGTIGWLYYRKGIYATALQHLQDAVRQDGAASGRNPASRKYYLGMTYLKLGDRARGLEMLEQALRSGPDMPEASEARAALRAASSAGRQ
jgi:tetratricopeptide (TPR) repeat protein